MNFVNNKLTTNGLFIYRRNDSYPIDNNMAERSVRPFTTK